MPSAPERPARADRESAHPAARCERHERSSSVSSGANGRSIRGASSRRTRSSSTGGLSVAPKCFIQCLPTQGLDGGYREPRVAGAAGGAARRPLGPPACGPRGGRGVRRAAVVVPGWVACPAMFEGLGAQRPTLVPDGAGRVSLLNGASAAMPLFRRLICTPGRAASAGWGNTRGDIFAGQAPCPPGSGP